MYHSVLLLQEFESSPTLHLVLCHCRLFCHCRWEAKKQGTNFNERRTDRNQLMSITLFTGDSRESGEIQSGQKPNEDR